MPEEIEVTYRVVTPMFCSGINPDSPEVRLPSFKGVLRYWWRALEWSHHGANLKDIREQEKALFGSADGGQSKVSMRLLPTSEPPKVSKNEVLHVSLTSNAVVGEGARYLGYGIMETFASSKKKTKSGQLKRGCIHVPFDFTVHMRGSRLNKRELKSLKDALIALGILGGMGARSRNGYGSLAIQSLRVNGNEQWNVPRSINDLCDKIKALQHNKNPSNLPEYPEYTALSDKTRHVLLTSNKKYPLELLDLIGRELVRFRSWGRGGKILGGKVKSECKFKDDHDLMKENKEDRRTHPRRISFGLPHNYGTKKDQKVSPYEELLDRRASPLFIHIHECEGMPVAVISFFPTCFLPKDEEGRSYISVGGNKVPQQQEEKLYLPIHDFLDRLLDQNMRQEHFERTREVKP